MGVSVVGADGVSTPALAEHVIMDEANADWDVLYPFSQVRALVFCQTGSA
jgi:hypothetical protein